MSSEISTTFTTFLVRIAWRYNKLAPERKTDSGMVVRQAQYPLSPSPSVLGCSSRKSTLRGRPSLASGLLLDGRNQGLDTVYAHTRSGRGGDRPYLVLSDVSSLMGVFRGASLIELDRELRRNLDDPADTTGANTLRSGAVRDRNGKSQWQNV